MTQRSTAILAATTLLAAALGVSAAHANPVTPTTSTQQKAAAGSFVKAEGARDTPKVSSEGSDDMNGNTGAVSSEGANDLHTSTGMVSAEGAHDLTSSQFKGSTTTSTQQKGSTAPASTQLKGAMGGGSTGG